MYHWVKPSSNGVWGTFVIRREKDFNQQEWEQQKRQREQAKLEKIKKRRSLPLDQRDCEIRKLLGQLTLSDEHRANLLARGFSDEDIERLNYKSITPYQRIKEKVHPDLAGVTDSGTVIDTAHEGIIIPIPDGNGDYMGCQERLDYATKGRYRWLSREQKSPHINGEMPLAVYYPPDPSQWDGTILLTESTGFKPALAAKRLGSPTIGAAGGNFII